MVWETRKRGTSYYTRSRWLNGRVVREYIGTGALGEIAASEDELGRLQKEEAIAYWKEELGRLERDATFLKEVEEAAEILTRAYLIAALSEKVEVGDKGARKELRKAVRESAPDVICRASDISRRGRWVLIKAAAANDPLTEEALLPRVELISADVAGPDPSALEVLNSGSPQQRWYVRCGYHAATEPLVKESNEFGVCLELVRAYLKGARRQRAGRLVEVLERAEADFSERHALAEKVLNDLRAA